MPAEAIQVVDLQGRDPAEVVRAVFKARAIIARVVPTAVAHSTAAGEFVRPPPGCFWVCLIGVDDRTKEFDAYLLVLAKEQLAKNQTVKLRDIEQYLAKCGGNALFAYYREGEFYMGEMVDVTFRDGPCENRGPEPEGGGPHGL